MQIKIDRFILFIFIIAFSLRIGYALLEKVPPFIDAVGYDAIGKNIAEGNGYRTSGGPLENDDAVVCPPAYPFFLGLIYKIFGHSYTAVWVIQSVMGAFVCFLIYSIAYRIFGPEVARISAVISATCLNFIMYNAMLFAENLFLLLVLLCFIYIYKAGISGAGSAYLIAGAFAGSSALTRPIVLPFFLFFILVSFRKNKRGMFLFSLPLILFVSLWIVRNYHIYHRFVPVSSGSGAMFWVGHNPQAGGKFDLPEGLVEDTGYGYLKIDGLGYRRGLEFIVRHPVDTMLLELKKVSLFFSLLRMDLWWPHIKGAERILSSVILLLFNLVIFGLGIPGLVFSYLKADKYSGWMRRFIYVSILSLIPFLIETRYRLTIYPFMIIFAGYALVKLPDIRQAFVTRDKSLIRLSYLAASLVILFVFNSFYYLFSYRNDLDFWLSILRSGKPFP